MDVHKHEEKMKQVVGRFREDIKKVRTGRAHADMLDSVIVEAYGTHLPLNQLGTVSAPEPQSLQVTPFDSSNVQAIAAAIRGNNDLGMNPMDDGRVVRVPVPSLTEERRREYVKLLHGKVEDFLVQLRNVRRDAMDAVGKSKSDKILSEDDARRLEKQVDEYTNKAKNDLYNSAKAKEAEIMTV